MTDKAVSTEDLCIDLPARHPSMEAARMDAVIRTLIENKVESLKNAKRKSSSITSSPKRLFNKLRGTSTSTVSSKDREVEDPSNKNEDILVPKHQIVSSESKRAVLILGSASARCSPSTSPNRRSNRAHLHFSDDRQESYVFLRENDQYVSARDRCYCNKVANNEMHVHVDENFISLNMEDYDHLNPEELEAMRTLQRAQRKKRRRRKRHRQMKKQLALSVAATVPDKAKHRPLDDDDLSERARMAIILTAFLLLFMCLLLVGITLRMAPLIDDMVRKENEELMNSLAQENSNHDGLRNLTASVPYSLK